MLTVDIPKRKPVREGHFNEFYGTVGEEAYRGWTYTGFGGKLSGIVLVGVDDFAQNNENADMGLWFYQNQENGIKVWIDGPFPNGGNDAHLLDEEYNELLSFVAAIEEGGDPEPFVDWILERHCRWMGMVGC